MPGPHGGQIDVLGLCGYCDTPTRTVCRLCGTAMCADHTAEGADICVTCAQGRSRE